MVLVLIYLLYNKQITFKILLASSASDGSLIGWKIALFHKKIFGRSTSTPHWDFLPKFLSLHYYTTLEGVLGVQRSGQAQGTNLFVWSAVFRPKQNDIQKTYKNYQNPVKSYCFLGYFQSLFNFGWKTAAQTNQMNLS